MIMKSPEKEEAMLCIKVTLLCLVKSPSRRPSMEEVVRMLSGGMEPPQLPTEYSSSSPSPFPFKSRKNGAGNRCDLFGPPLAIGTAMGIAYDLFGPCLAQPPHLPPCVLHSHLPPRPPPSSSFPSLPASQQHAIRSYEQLMVRRKPVAHWIQPNIWKFG